MANFQYRARDDRGRPCEGSLAASTSAEALRSLQGQGLHVLALVEIDDQRRDDLRSNRAARARLDDLAAISQQLAIMVRAGVPVTEALSSVMDQSRSRILRRVLADVLQNVMQGYSLSQAAARYPGVFPRLFVDMVRTGESSGDLAEVLDRLADYLDNSVDTARKVKSALMYPTVIVIISIATVVLLTTFVLPRFIKLFRSMEVAIPPTTKALLALSTFATHHWYLLAGGVAALAIAVKIGAASPNGRYLIDWATLRLPIMGDIARKIIIARLSMALGTLLNGGVPLKETLDTGAEVTGNAVFAEAVRSARDAVQSGVDMADAVRHTGQFPPLVIQMVAAGEKTGQLPEMLLQVATFYNRETEARVRGLTSILEPALIVFLGAFVGLIAISIISPIYSLVGGVK
jgi:type IV pilus assembly protein PilC